MKLNVVTTEKHRRYLHTKFYPIFYSQC